MAIKTSTFGGWRLTGADAKAFKKQMSDQTPNPLAQASYERGKVLAKQMAEQGFAVIRPRKKKDQ